MLSIISHWRLVGAALLVLGALGTVAGTWLYISGLKSTILSKEQEIDTLQDTVIDREEDIARLDSVLTQAKEQMIKAEELAIARQTKINALNKSVRADRLRASDARCVPIKRP